MDAIIEAIVAFGKWLLGLVKAVIEAIWDFFTDILCYLFDKLLSVAVTALQGLNVSAVSGLNPWATLPGDVLNVLGVIGLGQCFAIIAGAIGIRLILQLIPFVRLGS